MATGSSLSKGLIEGRREKGALHPIKIMQKSVKKQSRHKLEKIEKQKSAIPPQVSYNFDKGRGKRGRGSRESKERMDAPL